MQDNCQMLRAQVKRARVSQITSKPDGTFVVRFRGYRDEPRRVVTRDLEETLHELSLRRQAT